MSQLTDSYVYGLEIRLRLLLLVYLIYSIECENVLSTHVTTI